MRLLLKVVGVLLALVVLAGVGFYVWASIASSRALNRTHAVHSVDFPIPFPAMAAPPAEGAAADAAGPADAGGQAQATADDATVATTTEQLARDQALERGRHLVQSRYGCTECHGADFGGGVMIDSAAIGRLFGPNLTTGQGSRTRDYTAADWDHAVRHGVLADGRTSIMPAVDFQLMSDQELSDIVTYIRAQPPVDNEVARPAAGPLGKILIATGNMELSADVIPADRPHPRYPPETAATLEFGQHVGAICTGCHREDLGGGPIPGGDPSWPPAANLTMHETGLGAWSFDEFVTLLRQGTRPDGSAVVLPMSAVISYSKNMTDTELQALWLYLQDQTPVPTRN